MNTQFHRAVALIAFNSMDEGFREKFLTGFSLELLLEYCDVPYVSERFGESEHLHIDHTYKLYLKGRDLHRIGEGDALGEIVKFSKSIQELAKAENGMLVRYTIAKATHYLIDIATFPHVNHEIWDKYHEKFESQASDWLLIHEHIVKELIKNYKPDPYRSVQNRVRAVAERAYFDSIDFLPCYKRNGMVTDLQWATLCCKHVYDVMDWFATFEKQL